MVGRSYTVKEIDDLRQVLTNKQAFGIYDKNRVKFGISVKEYKGGFSTHIFKASPDLVLVEEQVRTHMLAGHTAQDLIDSEGKEDVLVEL